MHWGNCLDGSVRKLPAPGITPKRSILGAWGCMHMPGGRSQARAASKHACSAGIFCGCCCSCGYNFISHNTVLTAAAAANRAINFVLRVVWFAYFRWQKGNYWESNWQYHASILS